ncbi:PilZ domain-containing protein [Sphingomonas sp.]|uniref:PilZ domain-containing protein n=1 Tax=Sphingomonas sp. TaxID=28214 RepID=UPI0025FAFDEB|nr:PilZ domain-containing protein [Sphingomonas sp.]
MSASQDKFQGAIERRTENRILGRFAARLRQSAGKPLAVSVYDLSARGFCTEWPHRLSVGDRVWLTLDRIESLAAIVSWTTDFAIGCKFERPLHPATLNTIADSSDRR